MAEIFKKIGHGVSVASKNVKDSIDISKKRSEIKKQINEGTMKIEEMKLSIGERVYDAYKKNARAESTVDTCKEIDGIYLQLRSLESQLLEIDGIKLCEKCGAKIPLDAVFCSRCGERQIASFGNDNTVQDSHSDDEDNMISL